VLGGCRGARNQYPCHVVENARVLRGFRKRRTHDQPKMRQGPHEGTPQMSTRTNSLRNSWQTRRQTRLYWRFVGGLSEMRQRPRERATTCQNSQMPQESPARQIRRRECNGDLLEDVLEDSPEDAPRTGNCLEETNS
jgi:hypothetical protein